MKHVCGLVVLLTLSVLIVASDECPYKEKKLNKAMQQYNTKCLQKGFQSSLGCESSDGKLKKKDLKKCSKLEKILKKCGHICPIDGNWGEFGDWSDCSAACGGGSKRRTRSCSNPAPANGGSNCIGDSEETKECNDQPCELYPLKVFCDDYTTIYIDGIEKYNDTNYQTLAELSVPSPSRVVAVKCHNKGGDWGIVAEMRDAEGNGIMVTDNSWRCAGLEESGWEKPDFVEGDNWEEPLDRGDEHVMRDNSEESNWNQITSPERRVIWSSGDIKDRTAYCRIKLKRCGHTCPIDGNWGEFGDWSDCSAACGGGSKRRTRSCSNPAPANGGSNCIGDSEETKECNDQPCELYPLKVFCDDYTTIYIDGIEKYNDTNYQTLAELSVPSPSRVVAVKCHNKGGDWGIVAEMRDAEGNGIMVTDNSWRCAGLEESGWEKPDFVEGDNWEEPLDRGDEHVMRDNSEESNWNQITSPERRVIWSSGDIKDRTAYCRIKLN